MSLRSIITVCICVSALVVGQAQILNIENRRIVTDTAGFAGKVSTSINASKFTQSFMSFDLNGNVQYKTDKNLFLFYGSYEIIRAGGENFNNSGFVHLRYNRKLSKVVRFELFSQVQNNAVTKIKSRFLNGVGLRFKLSQYERAKFYWGVAGMYEHETVDDPREVHDDIRLSSYLTFTLMPEKTVSFRNTTYAQPRIDDFKDIRVSNSSRLLFNISKQLRFTVDLSFLYDEFPPPGVPSVNYQIKNGLQYTL